MNSPGHSADTIPSITSSPVPGQERYRSRGDEQTLARTRVESSIRPAQSRLQLAESEGTYLETVRARTAMWTSSYAARSSGLAGPLNLVVHIYFALFLLGLYAGRQRLLTNYVAQGVLLTTLNDGYGFGMLGRLGSLTLTLIAIAFFGLQVAYSNLWLSHFAYGPLEWLWRKLTYRQLVNVPRGAEVRIA